MKKHVMSMIVVVVIAFAAYTEASLISLNGTVTDTTSGLIWYSDLAGFAGQTYAEQLQSIANLNATSFGGKNTWRMATYWDLRTLLPQLYNNYSLFTPSLDGSDSQPVWYGGRYDQFAGDLWGGIYNAYRFTPSWLPNYPDGYETVYNIDSTGNSFTSVWITSGPSTVPEPSTFLLFGFGLTGLGVYRKRIRRA